MVFLPEIDTSDVRSGSNLIERLTADAASLQQDVLREILARNAHTDYLRRFLKPEAAADAFKKHVPVASYEDVKPCIDRIVSGKPSSLLCSEPITDLLKSTGTSGGQYKLLPSTAEELDRKVFFFAVKALVRKMHLQADQAKDSKGMCLMFSNHPEHRTLSGLPITSALTAYYNSSQFRDRDIGEFDKCTSPLEAIHCRDTKQSMYCQLLCGLL